MLPSPAYAIFGLSHCEKVKSVAKKQDLAAQDLFKQGHTIAAPFSQGKDIDESNLIRVGVAYYKIRYGETNYADQNQECYSEKVIAGLKTLQTTYFNVAFKWMNVNSFGISLTNGMIATFAEGKDFTFKSVLY